VPYVAGLALNPQKKDLPVQSYETDWDKRITEFPPLPDEKMRLVMMRDRMLVWAPRTPEDFMPAEELMSRWPEKYPNGARSQEERAERFNADAAYMPVGGRKYLDGAFAHYCYAAGHKKYSIVKTLMTFFASRDRAIFKQAEDALDAFEYKEVLNDENV
jgi:hypothetical protein